MPFVSHIIKRYEKISAIIAFSQRKDIFSHHSFKISFECRVLFPNEYVTMLETRINDQ